MAKKIEEKVLKMNVYLAGEQVNRNAQIEKSYDGMFALEYEDIFLNLSRCDIKNFSRAILQCLQVNIKPKFVDKVIINYPDTQKGFVNSIDGYFGRLPFITGILKLSPLDEESKNILRTKINSLESFIVKDKEIKIISN